MLRTLNEMVLEHHKILLCVSKSLLGMRQKRVGVEEWSWEKGELGAGPSSACLHGFEDTLLLSIYNKIYR